MAVRKGPFDGIVVAGIIFLITFWAIVATAFWRHFHI